MRHRYVAPDGEQQREPNGDGVENLSDVRVNENVHRPRVVESLVNGALAQYVHVQRERDVLDHDQVVGHGEAGEDGVRRRDALVHAREHDDVERVGEGAEQAHHQADVAVHEQVRLAEDLEALAAVELGGHGHR